MIATGILVFVLGQKELSITDEFKSESFLRENRKQVRRNRNLNEWLHTLLSLRGYIFLQSIPVGRR